MTLLILFIYRIVSAILTIFVVVPLFLVYCVIAFLFNLINNFCYPNILNMEVPNEVLDKVGHDKLILAKFFMAITIPCVNFWESLKNLKSITL